MQTSNKLRKGIKALIFGLLAAILLVAAGAGMLTFSPSAGANGAEVLRRFIGDQNVAALETVLFQTQDALKQAEFHLGLIKPDNPFGQDASQPARQGSSLLANAYGSPAGGGKGASSLSIPPVSAPLPSLSGAGTSRNSASSAQSVSNAPAVHQGVEPASVAWMPGPITPLGSTPGEGRWQPYIQDASGKTVAYRAFIQPDPQRPYALTGVIAFDLSSVRLHYVIGFDDPYAPGAGPKKTGAIPVTDTKNLIAAFNGGFKYEHGHFGSMAAGLVSAPPRDGLGVAAMYRDGSVRIGEWGKDIQDSPDLVAFRQNGPLVIQDGQPTTQVDNDNLWGKTISGGVVTWRSGLAISQDGKTLYYFAGPSLTIHTLANAMMAAHPAAAIQMDINNYWVHFISIHSRNGKTTLEALYPDMMRADKDRYLHPYARDFFYVTSTYK